MTLKHVADKGQIVSENLTIAAGIITLSHLPDPAKPISIPGFTQTQTPIPLPGQFFVTYSSGILSFNAANTGTLSVTYTALGEEVTAALYNALVDGIIASGLQVFVIPFVASGAAQDILFTPPTPISTIVTGYIQDTGLPSLTFYSMPVLVGDLTGGIAGNQSVVALDAGQIHVKIQNATFAAGHNCKAVITVQ